MSLRFIDISNWQSGIDVMKVVRNGGLGAVVCKATEGIGWVDKQCDKYVQTLLSNGVPFGFYHYGRKNDASEEAEYFRASTENYERHGIPILDWEENQSVAWVNVFVRRYHELTGIWPWVYGNAWRFNQGKVEENCGRWIAGYPKANNPDIAYGEKHDFPYEVANGLVCAWQFSSTVEISGYSGHLDGNVFYGDAEAWERYATAGKYPNEPAPEAGMTLEEGDTLVVTGVTDATITLKKN